MAFNASSFFAGVGTVLVTIAVGFGGGIMMTNVLVGKSESKQPSKLEHPAPNTKAASDAPEVAAMPSPVQQTSPQPPAQPVQVSAPLAPPPQPAMQERNQTKAMARIQEAELKKALAAEKRKAQRRRWTARKYNEEKLRAVAEKAGRQEQGEPGRYAEPPFNPFSEPR